MPNRRAPIPFGTFETHRSKIMLKLGIHSLAEMIYYALRNDIAANGRFSHPVLLAIYCCNKGCGFSPVELPILQEQ